jgi:hypothetical protein
MEATEKLIGCPLQAVDLPEIEPAASGATHPKVFDDQIINPKISVKILAIDRLMFVGA